MTMPLRRIDTRSAGGPAGGVVKASVLASADAARSVIEQAQREAVSLLEQARARAQGRLQQLQAELEQRMWHSVSGYAEAMYGEWDRSLAELETYISALVGCAVRRLLAQAPADEQLRACVRQLVAQADVPDAGVLLVAEADHAAVQGLADRLPWPVQCSGDVSAGTVRLVSKHGRWECDVDGALERVLEALGDRTDRDMESDDGEPD